MTLVAAIDPGANGALCFLSDEGIMEFYDFKKLGLKGYIDAFKGLDTQLTGVIVESVTAMSGQGVTSMFSFGQRLGELEGMLQTLDIPYELVRPQKWQKTIGVEPKSGKQGIYDTISKIYPTAPLLGVKGGIQDGRCDALSMAYYKLLTLQ